MLIHINVLVGGDSTYIAIFLLLCNVHFLLLRNVMYIKKYIKVVIQGSDSLIQDSKPGQDIVRWLANSR